MPTYNKHIVVKIARQMKAFLRLRIGIARSEVPYFEAPVNPDQTRALKRAQSRVEKQQKLLEKQREQLARSEERISKRDQRIARLEKQLLASQREGKMEVHVGEQTQRGFQYTVEGNLYLDLMKRCLTGWIYADGRLRGRDKSFDQQVRQEGRDWPSTAHTMIGLRRLDNLQFCVEKVIADGVPGDLIETGVWRGGATIFMRAILKAYGVEDRQVWVADSFEGLPPPDLEKYPQDEGDHHHTFEELAVSLEEVKSNFERYGLLDEQVRFLKGWFRDTLPKAPIEKLAVIRVDGDMYESTMDALVNLYPKLSVGGYLIVDDYATHPACKQAVHDYRNREGIVEEIVPVDWTAAFWQRRQGEEQETEEASGTRNPEGPGACEIAGGTGPSW